MRLAMVVVLLIVAGVLINAIRGSEFPLPQVLPFLGGKDRPMLYQGAGVAMLLITLWGIGRLYHKDEDE